MTLLFRLMVKSRQQGMLSLERDVENPAESDIFKQYPRILNDPSLLDFITDYLRLMISGNMNAFEIEALMDVEIDTFEEECEIPANSINLLGDSLPAFGIVAVVLGMVHALGVVDRPVVELGVLIAQAMVGILLSYVFISPLASLLRLKKTETVKVLQCIKITLLSNLHGYAPKISIEFGRKSLFTTERPSFLELENHVKQARGLNKAAAQDGVQEAA